MLRKRGEADVRVKTPPDRRRVAPAPLRVLLIMAMVALVAALVGGSDGFWLAMPGVLLAGSVTSTSGGAIACTAPVLAADAAAASLVSAGRLPALWLMLLVPAASLAVLHGMGRRLRLERDALATAAFSDPLTGAANRRLLMATAEREIARHRRADERFTLVMLDLDGFKQLNDRYGHAAGDQMLRDVAVGLKLALRGQDTVARLGGDEFCVIAPQTENPRPLADRIASAVAHASVGNQELSSSLGVAVFPDDGTTVELLLRRADERLLAAKRSLHASPGKRAA
jgi:diguanylate cyclase (GGDEF)-like protein